MQLIKKYPLVSIVVTTLLIFAGAVLWVGTNGSETTKLTQSDSSLAEGGIRYEEGGKVVRYRGIVGETALETLLNLAEVGIASSDFGEYVTGINGVESTAGDNFWAFYINGQMASLGAGSYQSQEGDVIEWRLEEVRL